MEIMNPVKRMGNIPNGRVGQTAEAIREQVARVPQQVAAVVDERPIATISVAFGLGLVAGVGLVTLYCQSQQHQATTYETLAQRVTDAVRNALPQSLAAFRS
jgi:hypothetical protein